MAAKRKQGTLTTIGETVSSAAKTAVIAADDYIVKPVGKMLGLQGKKKAAKKKRPTTRNTARHSSTSAAKRSTKRPVKRPAKRRARP